MQGAKPAQSLPQSAPLLAWAFWLVCGVHAPCSERAASLPHPSVRSPMLPLHSRCALVPWWLPICQDVYTMALTPFQMFVADCKLYIDGSVVSC